MEYLSFIQIKELFSSLSPEDEVTFERVRPHNKTEIRKEEVKNLSKLLLEIEESIEEEWVYGGDLEILLPEGKGVLVGHHDGLYWVENNA